MNSFLRLHVGVFTATRGSHFFTLQRYCIPIAVFECFSNFFRVILSRPVVMIVKVKIVKIIFCLGIYANIYK